MICPRCGNNDVKDPEVCPKCGTVLKVKDEKIGARDSWKKNEYFIKKDKDVMFARTILVIVGLVLLIGGSIFFGIYFEVFSDKKSVKMPDALKYVNNINKYIEESNKENNSYKVDEIEYAFYSIPTSNHCTYNNGKWNNQECEYFMGDMNNYCKSLKNGCIMPPDEIDISFENGKVKNGSTLKFENVDCTYNLVKPEEPSNIKNIKCYQQKKQKA